jgi:hypothetical protein
MAIHDPLTATPIESQAPRHRTRRIVLAVAALLVLIVATAGIFIDRARTPSTSAEQRAAQTLAALSAPIESATAQPVVTYHWPSCEQGDCYNKSRTYRLAAPVPLGQVSAALDLWAAANGLQVAAEECLSPQQQTLLPEEHGCSRTLRSTGQDERYVTVWVHFAIGGSATVGSEPTDSFLARFQESSGCRVGGRRCGLRPAAAIGGAPEQDRQKRTNCRIERHR